jgi:hypothetical protein
VTTTGQTLKLQKQVDNLERNPKVSFVATNYAIYDEKTTKQKRQLLPSE